MSTLIDGTAVTEFCRERAARMKSALTAAIYAGLADRVARGAFAPAPSPVTISIAEYGEPVIACSECLTVIRALRDGEQIADLADAATEHTTSHHPIEEQS